MLLALSPVTGDCTLQLKPYTYSRIIPKEYTKWYETLTTCGDFNVTVSELRQELLIPLVAGYLVRDKDAIIGCAAVANSGGKTHVMYLWVHPDYRRKRIGWNLLNMCLLRAKKNGDYTIRARVNGNIPAQELFKKAGFKEENEDISISTAK